MKRQLSESEFATLADQDAFPKEVDMADTNSAAPNQEGSPESKPSHQPFNHKFVIPENVTIPPFKWTPTDLNPAEQSDNCCHLLINDTFIDKSAVLHYLLNRHFIYAAKDFKFVPIHMVYPRRFAKTTMLQFIEATFSPVGTIDVYNLHEVKMKIASLEYGDALLAFGLHPVLLLDMQNVDSVRELKTHIAEQLERAGLEEVTYNDSLTPKEILSNGIQMLNRKFKLETGVTTKTIVLIDEHDKAFRKQQPKMDLIEALMGIYTLGKGSSSRTGISLMILCGLTRIIGTGLSSMNNLIDVSVQCKYHGLCGLSSKEINACVKDQFDQYTKERYEGKTFQQALETVFALKWDGFRFGLDKTKGPLDPDSPEGSLFSPLDFWEIVRSIVEDDKLISSKWIKTMHSEFEFTNFAAKYKNSHTGARKLFNNLSEAFVSADELTDTMSREKYMLLDDDLYVRKALFELGLLSVKQGRTEMGQVLLGPPNIMVSTKALGLLIEKVMPVETPYDCAMEYLSEDGLKDIVSKAAASFTNAYRQTGKHVPPEYAFQDFLYFELMCCFPSCGTNYQLFKEKRSDNKKNPSGKGYIDVAVELLYEGRTKEVFLIEVKLAKIDKVDPEIIQFEHAKKQNEGTTQIKSYVWDNPAVEKVHSLVLSGVWHPEDSKSASYALNTQLNHVDPMP